LHRGIEGTAWLISKVALAVTIGLKKSKPQGLKPSQFFCGIRHV
jgi:hypothetical protein